MTFYSHLPYYTIEANNFPTAALTSWLLSQSYRKVDCDNPDWIIPEMTHPLDFIDWFEEKFGNVCKYLQDNKQEIINCLESFSPGWGEDSLSLNTLSLKEQVFNGHPDCIFAYINQQQLLHLKTFILDIGLWI